MGFGEKIGGFKEAPRKPEEPKKFPYIPLKRIVEVKEKYKPLRDAVVARSKVEERVLDHDIGEKHPEVAARRPSSMIG